MQCEKCGQTITEGAAFCANCGTPAPSKISSNDAAPQPVIQMAAPESMATPVSTPAATPVMGAATMAPGVMTSIEEPKKKLDSKMITMIAVSAVCLVIGIIGIVLAVSNSGNNSDSQVAVSNNDEGGSTVDVASSGTKVAYAGYEFVIPKGYDYEIDEIDGTEALAFSDDKTFVAATMYFNDVSFARIESGSDLLVENFVAEMGEPVTASTETVDGVKFICFDFGEREGMNIAFVVSDADLYYFKTVITTENGSGALDHLEDVAKIVGSARKKTDERAFNGSVFEGISIPKINLPVE